MGCLRRLLILQAGRDRGTYAAVRYTWFVCLLFRSLSNSEQLLDWDVTNSAPIVGSKASNGVLRIRRLAIRRLGLDDFDLN